MRLIVLLAIACIASSLLYAQGRMSNPEADLKKQSNERKEHRSLMPLSAGTLVPDVVIKNILNYKSPQAKISDFRGKLLVIDFWNKWCSSCISGFPKMEYLQKQFPNQVQVLLVTQNSLLELKTLLTKSENLKNTQLPIVTSDSTLSILFPHSGVPFHVWIDKEGRARFAGFGFTNFENIKAFLADGNMQLPYRLTYKDFDPRKSLLFETGARQKDNLKYYSFFMGRLTGTSKSKGKGPVMADSIQGKPIGGIQTINQTISQLLQSAYKFYIQNPNTHILLNVKAPQEYDYPKESVNLDEWKDKNLYSYGLYMPNASDSVLRSIMQNDLQRYFRLLVKFDKRKMKCLVLKRTTISDLIKSKNDEPNEEVTKNGLRLTNQQFGTLYFLIKNAVVDITNRNTLPFIDATGFNTVKAIDISINSKLNNIDNLKLELRRYGLDIIIEEREIDVMIINDNQQL